MNTMKKTLKSKFIENTIKFVDKQIIEASTKDCILILFDEPEMPKELIYDQINKIKK